MVLVQLFFAKLFFLYFGFYFLVVVFDGCSFFDAKDDEFPPWPTSRSDNNSLELSLLRVDCFGSLTLN